MKIYLAGPMRDLPEHNFPAFHTMAAGLRKQGHTVWSPAEHDEREGFDPKTDTAAPLRHYMKTDLVQVCEADAVAVMDGWEESTGAKLEVHVARECDIPVYEVTHSDRYGGVVYMNILREEEPWADFAFDITEEGRASLTSTAPPITGTVRVGGIGDFGMEFDRAEHLPSGAIRSDPTGKGRYDLLPPAALRRVAIVYEKGAAQKGDRNWENGIPDSRLYSSALRHIFQALEGKRDEDHVAHAAWNLLAILHFDSQREEVKAA